MLELAQRNAQRVMAGKGALSTTSLAGTAKSWMAPSRTMTRREGCVGQLILRPLVNYCRHPEIAPPDEPDERRALLQTAATVSSGRSGSFGRRMSELLVSMTTVGRAAKRVLTVATLVREQRQSSQW